jgi:hypothetical protein
VPGPYQRLSAFLLWQPSSPWPWPPPPLLPSWQPPPPLCASPPPQCASVPLPPSYPSGARGRPGRVSSSRACWTWCWWWWFLMKKKFTIVHYQMQSSTLTCLVGSALRGKYCYIRNTTSDSDGFRTGFQQWAQPLSTFHFLSISNTLPHSLTVTYSQPSIIAPIPA